MGLHTFTVSRRFRRHLKKLIAGSASVRTLYDSGKLITAEKKYNRLCIHYAECRILLSRKADELETKNVPKADALKELDETKNAFLAFYALADTFKVDISAQKEDTLAYIEKVSAVFRGKP
ncbi:MAG: hypothetical protein Q4Q04_00190 [Methanocorpusculum sp.]|nr:hypothetical protein [Methanocorpusculum sp.]